MPLLFRVIACQVVVFVLFALSPAVRSAAAWDSFVGQESCGFVVEQMEAEGEAATLIIAAFITGVNYATGRLTNADIEEMVSWVRDYCEREPSARFLDALIGLDEELDSRQTPAEETVPEPGEQPPLSAAVNQ
jgi:hypothetical protein